MLPLLTTLEDRIASPVHIAADDIEYHVDIAPRAHPG
jgi:hypothetical protein